MIDHHGGVFMPAWVTCPMCEDMWCNLHAKHACDCDCPPIEEWHAHPYSHPCVAILFHGVDDPVLVRRIGEKLFAEDDGVLVPWLEAPHGEAERQHADPEALC